MDLSRFRFDYDETWAAFFLNARGRVYARVFGRDHTSPLSHRSLEGLAATMEAVLDVHRREAADPPEPAPPVPWTRIEDVPAYRRWRRPGDCVHCHTVQEDLRRQAIADAAWKREDLWAWPPPEAWGLTPGRREPARVESVAPGSFAHRAGLREGDLLRRVGGTRILSWGDLFAAVDASPARGDVEVAYERQGAEARTTLRLEGDWRRSDLSWRVSIEALPPDPGLHGRGLDAAEKEALGLAPDALALRVQGVLKGGAAHWAGIEKNDVLLSLEVGGRATTRALDGRGFQAWFRAECVPGDRVAVEFLRSGARRRAVLELAK